MSNMLTTPSKLASRYTCHKWTAPEMSSSPSTRASRPAAAWVTNSSRRLSTRSTTSPAQVPKSSMGTNCKAVTNPKSTGLSVSRSTSHPWATVCIQVPETEITCPVKYSR